MIKRRDYRLLHKDHDRDDSSSSDSDADSEGAQDVSVSEDLEHDNDAASSEDEPVEEFIRRPHDELSEEDMSSGDEEGTGAQPLEPESEVERAAVAAREIVAVPSKTGRVFKCRLCKKVLCLSVHSLEQHLASKRHKSAKKQFAEGKRKLCVDSAGEDEGDEAETHAERHARTVTAAAKEQGLGKKKRQRGKPRDKKKKKKTQQEKLAGGEETKGGTEKRAKIDKATEMSKASAENARKVKKDKSGKANKDGPKPTPSEEKRRANQARDDAMEPSKKKGGQSKEGGTDHVQAKETATVGRKEKLGRGELVEQQKKAKKEPKGQLEDAVGSKKVRKGKKRARSAEPGSNGSQDHGKVHRKEQAETKRVNLTAEAHWEKLVAAGKRRKSS